MWEAPVGRLDETEEGLKQDCGCGNGEQGKETGDMIGRNG